MHDWTHEINILWYCVVFWFILVAVFYILQDPRFHQSVHCL